MSVGPANGTRLHYETAVAGTWQEVSCMVDFSGWSPTTAEVDVTCLTTGTGYREFQPGLKDPGTGDHTVRMDLEDALQYQAVFAMINSNPVEVRRWALEAPDNLHSGSDPDVIYATGYPSSVPLTGGVDTPFDWSLALRFSGAFVWATSLPAS